MTTFPNAQNNAAGAIPVYIAGAGGQPITNSAPSGSTIIAVGGTSQQLFAAGEIVNGAYIVNPTNAAELLYVNDTGAACTTTEGGNVYGIKAGQRFDIGSVSNSITVNAVSSAHVFSATKF